jgi:hypothetical protein
MQASATTLEKNLEASYKSNHKSAIWSSNPTPGNIPKGMRHRLLQRHLHTHVYAALFTIAKLWKNNQDAPLLTNRLRKCGIYAQWNSTQPWRRMKFCYSQVNGWNWRISFWARLARLRRPKIVCSPSYADFRSKANAATWLDLGHMIRGEHTWEVWG